MNNQAPHGAHGPRWILLVRPHSDSEDKRKREEDEHGRYKKLLESHGYRCIAGARYPLEPLPLEQCALVVQCGVSDNLTFARTTIHIVEDLYPKVPILVLTHHDNPANISRFATPRTTVLNKDAPHFEELLVRTVGELIANSKTAPSK